MTKKSSTLTAMRAYIPNSRKEYLSFIYGVAITIAVVFFLDNYKQNYSSFLKGSTNLLTIPIPMEPFPEDPWRTPQTLDARLIASTPFARFEIHKVKTESGVIVNDWLWTDERSHINILVHLKEEDKYLLFHQKKYGLDKAYYAAIGGLFNPGEKSPEDCARRELLEETGLDAEQMVSLGSYRVQVNRGGGILYAFLAHNCVPSKLKKISDDYEKQEWRKLTRAELIKVALDGEIGEAQWLATIALGIVYEETHEKSITPKN